VAIDFFGLKEYSGKPEIIVSKLGEIIIPPCP